MNINRIAELVGRNYKTEIKNIVKGGVEKQGLVVLIGNVSPVFYPADLDGTDEQIASYIIKDVNNMMINGRKFDLSIMENWDNAKDYIFAALRPRTTGHDCITFPHLDLEIYLYISFPAINGTAKLTEMNLDHWGVDTNLALKVALENSFKRINTFSMNSFLGGLLTADDDPLQLQVITNTDTFRGAIGMLHNSTLRKLCEDKGVDRLVIFPSSIHEVIVMPDNGNVDYEDMRDMVKAINASTVDPVDRLSNQIYSFNYHTGELKIII